MLLRGRVPWSVYQQWLDAPRRPERLPTPGSGQAGPEKPKPPTEKPDDPTTFGRPNAEGAD